MVKRLFVIFGLVIVFIAYQTTMQTVWAQKEQAPFANEQQTVEGSKGQLMPLMLQEKENQCIGLKKFLNDLLGIFACDSQQYQNITMPSQLAIQGEAGETVKGVAAATSEGQVKGITTIISDIAGLLGFTSKALSGPNEGALLKYFPNSFNTIFQSGNPNADIKKAVKEGQCMNMPLVLQQGCGAQQRTANYVPPAEEAPGNGVQPPPTAPYGGACSYGSGYCSLENLQKYFPTLGSAQRASIICQRESGSNPFSNNKSCQTGKTVDYSIGLFQINLLAHCAGAFSYTWNPPSCRILDQNKVDVCENNMQAPEKNIQEAVRISNNGTNWRPWSTARVCNVPDGDGPLEQQVPGSMPDAQPEQQIVGCPEPSRRIQIPETTYQHLDQQLTCIAPSRIVIHWSGAWTTAQATLNVLNSRKLSCQFAVDKTIGIQMLDFYPEYAQKGYCIGNQYNDDSINLEISGAWFDEIISPYSQSAPHIPSSHYRYEDLIKETDKSIQLVCWLLERYNIPKTEIYGHYQLYDGKSDPGVEYLKYFKDRVQNECQ